MADHALHCDCRIELLKHMDALEDVQEQLDRAYSDLRKADVGRERQRAMAAGRRHSLNALMITIRQIAAQIGDHDHGSPLSFSDRLEAACNETEQADHQRALEFSTEANHGQ